MPTTTTNPFKEWREAKQLTQFQAAIAMGVTPSALSGWENGSPPRLSLVSKIAEVYGVDEDLVLRTAHEFSKAAKSDDA
jgi:transcriptional regulator with XRE-family HTH domain